MSLVLRTLAVGAGEGAGPVVSVSTVAVAAPLEVEADAAAARRACCGEGWEKVSELAPLSDSWSPE